MRRALPLFSLFLLGACGREPGGDPLRVVPAAVESALVVPSLADLQQRAATFLAGIEGASGVLDLVADRFGLDLRTAEGPAALGLDAARGLAVFTRPGSCEAPPCAPVLVAAVSVAEPARFLDGVAARLQRAAGLTPRGERGPLGSAQVFAGPSVAVALGVTTDRVGLFALTTPDRDPLEVWREAAAGPAERFIGSKRDAVASALAPEAPLRFVTGNVLPEPPSALGLFRGFASSLRDKLPEWQGAVALSADSLTIKLSGHDPAAQAASPEGAAPTGGLPISWVSSPTPRASPLAEAFPKTTTGFLRLRVNLDKVRALPSFVRNNVLPDQLPGLEGVPLPTVPDLVNLVEGDVAVSLLGLDPSATLADFGSPRSLRERGLGLFRVALAARMRDAAGTRRAFASIAEQLQTSGWTVAPIAGKPPTAEAGAKAKAAWTGWTFVRDDKHYSVLLDDEVCVFVIGQGEVEGFLAARDGRALPLASVGAPPAGTAVVRAALGTEASGGGFLGVALSPLRLTRELAARSVPPYFLKMVNDVRLASLVVDASATTLSISLELDL